MSDTRAVPVEIPSIRDPVEGVTPTTEVSLGSPALARIASTNWRWGSEERGSVGKPSEDRWESPASQNGMWWATQKV